MREGYSLKFQIITVISQIYVVQFKDKYNQNFEALTSALKMQKKVNKFNRRSLAKIYKKKLNLSLSHGTFSNGTGTQ